MGRTHLGGALAVVAAFAVGLVELASAAGDEPTTADLAAIARSLT